MRGGPWKANEPHCRSPPPRIASTRAWMATTSSACMRLRSSGRRSSYRASRSDHGERSARATRPPRWRRVPHAGHASRSASSSCAASLGSWGSMRVPWTEASRAACASPGGVRSIRPSIRSPRCSGDPAPHSPAAPRQRADSLPNGRATSPPGRVFCPGSLRRWLQCWAGPGVRSSIRSTPSLRAISASARRNGSRRVLRRSRPSARPTTARGRSGPVRERSPGSALCPVHVLLNEQQRHHLAELAQHQRQILRQRCRADVAEGHVSRR